MMLTGPASLPMVGLEAVKGLLPVRSGNSDFDERINLCIRAATGLIERALERKLTGGAYVDTFRSINSTSPTYDFLNPTNASGVGYDMRRQRLALTAAVADPAMPFEVRYDLTRRFGADSVVDPNSYVVEYAHGVVWLEVQTREGLNSVRIAYAGGFAPNAAGTQLDEASLPADLHLACITQAVHLFTRSTPDNIGVEADRGQGKVAAGRFTSRGGLCPEAMALIVPYAQPRLGRG